MRRQGPAIIHSFCSICERSIFLSFIIKRNQTNHRYMDINYQTEKTNVIVQDMKIIKQLTQDTLDEFSTSMTGSRFIFTSFALWVLLLLMVGITVFQKRIFLGRKELSVSIIISLFLDTRREYCLLFSWYGDNSRFLGKKERFMTKPKRNV